MARPKKQCPKCGLLDTLELERIDMSYKKYGINPVPLPAEPVAKPVVKAVDMPVHDDTRDKLMFNAGRYAGGATDNVALLAHLKLQQLLKKD